MKFLKYLFFLVLIVIIGTAIYIATLDSNYNIQRTRVIKAPVEVVFNSINDYKNWQHWGPWYEMDSTIVASYPEQTSGVGGSYTWTGKDGNGSMKTLSLISNKEIIQEIDFGMGSTPLVYWLFNEVDGNVELTWGMKGESTFSEKAYFLTQGGVDKAMGPMFDRGLELFDSYLLKQMNAHSFNVQGVVDFGGGYYLYRTTSCKMEDIERKMGEMFPTVMQYMTDNNITPAGLPFTLHHKWDEENNTTIFSTAIPVMERIITTGDVLSGHLKKQKTYKTTLKGAYKHLKMAWSESYKNLSESGLKPLENGEPFEVYKVSPHDAPNPAQWVTEIYIPIE